VCNDLAWMLNRDRSQQGANDPQGLVAGDLAKHPLRLADKEYNEKQWHKVCACSPGAIAKL
jgi:hypothetical protein